MHSKRRDFLMTGAGLAASTLIDAQDSKPLTAGQVVDRIKAHIGIPWREQTVDRIIAVDPDTPVKGIATTMMATGCTAACVGGGEESGDHA